jgi:hypothetical protein
MAKECEKDGFVKTGSRVPRQKPVSTRPCPDLKEFQ